MDREIRFYFYVSIFVSNFIFTLIVCFILYVYIGGICNTRVQMAKNAIGIESYVIDDCVPPNGEYFHRPLIKI